MIRLDLPDTPGMRAVLEYLRDNVCGDEIRDASSCGDVGRTAAWCALEEKLDDELARAGTT